MKLEERCEQFIKALGIKVTEFCANVGIGRTTYYIWKKGDLQLSDKTLKRIDEYLQKFGF